MTDINAFAPSVLPPAQLPGADARALEAQGGAAPVQAPATDRPITEIPANVPGLATGQPATAQAAGTVLISNANNAPGISEPNADMSAEDMAALLLSLQGKTQEDQLKTLKNALGMARLKMDENHKKSMDKIDKWIKDCEAAEKKSKMGGIFGWLGKIAAFVGSLIATVALVVATPVTGGAAAPLLALSVMGLVGSTMALASAISQEVGGPALDVGTLMTKACTALLKLAGVPEDKLEAAGRIMAGGLGVATGAVFADPQLLGNLGVGIAQMATDDQTTLAICGAVFSALAAITVAAVSIVATGGAGAASAASKVTSTMAQAAKVVQAGAATTAGVSSMVAGGLNIGKAMDEHSAAMAQVDRQKFSALLVKLQAAMEEDQAQIKKIVQQIQDGYSTVSKMISAAGESREQISANIGHTMA